MILRYFAWCVLLCVFKDFAWSSQVYKLLKDQFKLDQFRTNQLACINVTLMKKDAIVIMPTGSGKSLCYQLPALIDKGTTVVISPMISLMEDQIGQLRKLNIAAEMLQASNSREENGRVLKLMTDSSSNSLKLLYVSPEKLAKSKLFMTRLQQMYKAGNLARIAIDEVHCCSTWGHDFRPDYQYLSILKNMFPNVPILGLTATATTKVMLDVQKMLHIEGCVVIKAPFNRPNLFYEVRVKPPTQKESFDELVDLLSNRFRNQSGIIYTTSIKECEDLRDVLKSRKLRVQAYHAKLESARRSSVHTKWLSGELQAVVATIAFGLGIDKPDVRFVIHYCLSKSMENFYQESGRAGRDGQTAHCILYYRLADVFKISPMVFDQQTGLPNLYNVVDYCLDVARCRRSIIAGYFDEPWTDLHCNKMCDHCLNGTLVAKKVEITKHARTISTILDRLEDDNVQVTAAMLIDIWFKQKVAKVKKTILPKFPQPTFPRDTGEKIIAYLIIKNYLKQDFHFTPYTTISYLKPGPNARHLINDEHTVTMNVAGKRDKKSNEKVDSKNVDETVDSKSAVDKGASSKSVKSLNGRKDRDKRSIEKGDGGRTNNDGVLRDVTGDNGEISSSNESSGTKESSNSKCRKENSLEESKDDEVSSSGDDRESGKRRHDEDSIKSSKKRCLEEDCIDVLSDSDNDSFKKRKTDDSSNKKCEIDLSSDDEIS